MTLINLPDSHDIIELKLWGRWRHFDEVNRLGSSPGFGHSLDVIVGVIRYAILNNLYPIINDEDWWYGPWTNFFEPFFDLSEKEDKIKNFKSKKVVDIEDVNVDYGGHYVHKDPLFYEILEKIYHLNNATQTKIKDTVTQYNDIDLALHIRIKYENDFNLNLNAYKLAFDQYLKNSEITNNLKKIFLLTDDFRAVKLCETYFQIPINTLCTQDFDGSVDRTPKNLLQLLTEIEIAKSAKHFVGSQYSSIPRLINFFRKGVNTHILPVHPSQ